MKNSLLKLMMLVPSLFLWQGVNGQYCSTGPSSTADSNIESVDITGENATTISYTGCPGVIGLENLTTQSVDLTAGNIYSLDVQFGTCGGNYNGAGAAWIDYNQNQIFEASEMLGSSSGTPGTAPWNGVVTFSFSVPPASTAGVTRIRVMQQEGGVNPLDPCATFTWGSKIDFAADITVPASTCPFPSNLLSSGLTGTGVTVDWTENGTATQWNIEWGAPGFAPGTGNEIGADNGNTSQTSVITGLTPVTSYDIFVQADCGGGDQSFWIGPLSVTTPCVIVSAPWSEDFSNAGAIPNCWNQGAGNSESWLFANTGGFNHIGSNGTLGGTTPSGGYFAWVDDSSPSSLSTSLLSPLIDVSSLTSPMLSFFLISDNEGNTNVDFSVDIWDGAAWNVGVYTNNSNTSGNAWQEIDVYMSPLTITGPIQIRFVVDETNGGDFYDDVAIDDVEIREAPTCLPIVDIDTVNVTTNSVELSWTELNGNNDWVIEYGPAGFTQGSGTMVSVTSNPYTITPLSPSTNYDFYVLTVCTPTDSSAWRGPFSQYTDCGIVVAPYYEALNGGSQPQCWLNESSLVNTGVNNFWKFSGQAGYAAANNGRLAGTFAWVDGDFPYSDSVKLTTPQIDLSQMTAPYLAFEWFSNNTNVPGDNNPLMVELFDGTSWILLDSLSGDNPEWQFENYDLAAYINNLIQIRFTVNKTAISSSSWNNDILLDEIIIDECIDLGGIDGSFDVCRLDLNVDLDDNIITKPNGGGEWSFPSEPSYLVDSLFTVTLLPTGSYDVFYVERNVCYDTTFATINVFGPSSAGMDGTIDVCKNEPINLYGALTGNTDLGGDWYDFNNTLLANSQPKAQNIPGQYNYTYIVSNGVCPADTSIVEVGVLDECDWLSVGEELFTDISVYPNPTMNILNIVNPSNTSSLKIEMFDMNGRVVFVEDKALINASEASIAIDHLEKGIYTLRVYNTVGQKTFKIVKQ